MATRQTIKQVASRLLGRRGQLSLAERFPAARIGRHTYASNLRVHDWGEGSKLTIGSFCSIAADVQIFLGGEHRTDWASTFPFNVLWPQAKAIQGHPASKGDVVIGNDVWIGHGAAILSGVTIGDGAVVGAFSLVTKSVAPYTIVGGNPAKPLRYRFEPEIVASLLAIRWWEWSDDKIAEHLPLLLQPNIRRFVESALAPDSHAT